MSLSFNHWWRQLRFRLENKEDWNDILDDVFLLHTKLIDDVPLFYAAKKNSVGCINNLLRYASTNIFERGGLGETALHIAVMNDNLEAAVALMDGAPELINEPMTSELFQGVTPLHIAVINQNISLVQHLISRGADVSTPRATGLYFKKRKGGLLYYGEHILSFAACTGNEDIISTLIDAGASTRVQDYKGNTVLHVLVLQPNSLTACQTFDLFMSRDAELDHSVPLDKKPNLRGLTPFKLAAKRGNVVVFQHLVNKRRVFQGSLGPLTSNLYDLTEIDSWADNKSVLEVVVSSQRREARRILEVTPVRELVSLKWNLYGKHYFRFLLFVYLLYICIFTACCLSRPLKDIPANYPRPNTIYSFNTIYVQKRFNESYVTYGDHVRMGGEIISVVGAVAMILLEIPDILRVGAKRYFGQTALGGPFHVILIIYAGFVVLLCVFRVCEVQEEMSVMAVCLVLGWCNVMFFARGFEMFGPYVIMIQKMIFEDLLKFMWLLIIVIIGYATAVWTHYMTQDPLSVPDYTSLPVMFFSEFVLDTTFINLPIDETVPTPPIVYIVHVSFTLFSSVLLTNVLVVMMNDTMSRVGQERDELWRTQVVATTLMIERRLPRRLWPRLGICGLNNGPKDHWFLRVETRYDQMIPKMKQYIKAFSKEDEKEMMALKTDTTKGSVSGKILGCSNSNKGSRSGWKLISHIIWGFGDGAES
ncbi:transient receptor potential cation channel subfamily V member 5-like isoform X1 [Anabas testudineus]|uniref:Transient receptor potential cation channel, subfamily V, member 6 n=1 Tax=Anabas testudineus TaxID=64144 RepID=A0AAQ6IND4_ANATE|nr:transient receptor potential cation channel subfamily V member 5-like isoform X1 [Anabas testudineus]